jgi:hypothetical protein
MPDNDIAYRAIPNHWKHWRKPLRLAAGGSTPLEVGDLIRPALAETWRQESGCQNIPHLAARLREGALSGNWETWHEERERFLQANGQRQIARHVVDQAEARLLTDPAGIRFAHSDRALALELTGDALRALTHDRLWARSEHEVSAKRGETFAETQAFIQQATEAASIEATAERALAHPDGSGMQAPPSRAARRSTADQLHEPIDL